MNSDLPLNQGQQVAADGFFAFLLDDSQRELIISGPGGVGKTFLMGYLINKIIPQYHETCQLMGIKPLYTSVEMTATTNKAADVLSSNTGQYTNTIQSFLNLKVKDDYSTGESKLIKTNKWFIHHNKVIFIDEASMIDRALLEHIREGTCNCKIIYVGDHCQLAPVKEPLSPIYKQNLSFFELTEPMRNNGQPALMHLCDQLRDTVEGGNFYDIFTVPGVVDHFNNEQMEDYITQSFADSNHNQRILTYTNQRVTAYNDFVRQIRNITDLYVVGETMVNNSAIQLRDAMLSVEEEVTILAVPSQSKMIEVSAGVELEVLAIDVTTHFCGDQTIEVPVDKEHFNKLLKFYSGTKNWNRYFFLKNNFPDLRPRDASTIHKAQGSTYDTVVIDLGNISTCNNPNQVARMLYVAISRARHRVILFGELAEKYGIVQNAS